MTPAGPIVTAGVYGLTAEDYHTDPVGDHGSLSSSGARLLLKTCPARFRWDRDHPTPYKRVFDVGHAAHARALGTGPELVRVDRQAWTTKAVKEEVQAIRAAGAVPLRPSDWDTVHGMAEALKSDPVVRTLLGTGHPEVTLAWQDGPGWCRAMLDWLPEDRRGRMLVPEYKTAKSAHPRDLRKAFYDYGYHMQAEWNLAGLQALGLADSYARMLFIVQEKDPPYLVTVAQPDDFSVVQVAREENRRALRIFTECQESGRWPGYSDDIELISLPPWVEIEYEKRHP